MPKGLPSTKHLPPELAEPGAVVFHYTPAKKAIEKILPAMKLLLNPFTRMRDPREAKKWAPYVAGDADESTYSRLEVRLNGLKREFKVLSLTRDHETDPTDWGRGYARPATMGAIRGPESGVSVSCSIRIA